MRRAGEQPIFQLRSDTNALGAGGATLLAAAAPWQPCRGDINLGSVRMGRTGVLFTSSQGQASRLINGLLDGRSTVVRNYTGEAGRPMEVRVLPVSFAKAYSDYGVRQQIAADELRPDSPDAGELPRGIELDSAARARLDVILDYLKADPSVNHIELDGHSDNSGNRLTNRDTSRRRAWRSPITSRPMVCHRSRSPCASTASDTARAQQQCRQPGAQPPGEHPAGSRRAGGKPVEAPTDKPAGQPPATPPATAPATPAAAVAGPRTGKAV